MMNRRATLLSLFAISLLATMAFLHLRVSTATRSPLDSLDSVAAGPGTGAAREATGRRDPRTASVRSEKEDSELEDRLVLMLRHIYGDRISSTSVQVLMAQVRTQVMTLFPQDWAKRFRQILEAAFPGYSARILATLANVDAYDKWFADNEDELAGLTPEEMEAAVRAKKRELFGEQALEELDTEARAAEQREVAIHDTMRSLEESSGTTVDQKLDVFVDALHENLSEGTAAIALENGSTLAHAFFGLESVSRQLAEMAPEARQRKINDIRRQFGYDEDQIAALEELDREREATWQTGYAYTNERRALENRFPGDGLGPQLAALRERYFGENARIIELEENEGFFRFERPRLHGRN
ncbi:MAG: hypothetical protein ABR538_00120 [Candidatus Binatia bacterium]